MSCAASAVGRGGTTHSKYMFSPTAPRRATKLPAEPSNVLSLRNITVCCHVAVSLSVAPGASGWLQEGPSEPLGGLGGNRKRNGVPASASAGASRRFFTKEAQIRASVRAPPRFASDARRRRRPCNGAGRCPPRRLERRRRPFRPGRQA